MPLKHKNIKTPFLVPLWCCFIHLAQSDAVADELDTLQFNAGIVKTYDNNLFRRNTDATSDQYTVSSLGVKLDKTYSLQRVTLDATYLDYKYNRSDFLDYHATNYNAVWYWSLTPNLTGTLSSERSQVLNDFRDFRSAIPTQNIRTIETQQFRAEYSPHQVWSLIAGATYTDMTNSQQFNEQADFDATAFDYGAKYRFPSGTYVTFLGHRRRGEFSKRVLSPLLQFDNGYDENEFELDVVFRATGKSNLSGKIGRLDREYDNFTQRNYSEYIGYVNYDWLFTSKLKVNLSYFRTVSPFEQINSTYSRTDSLRAELTYYYSDKLLATVNAKSSERKFDGRGQFSTSNREDDEQSFGGMIKWTPIKNVSLSLNSTRSYRDSTLSQFDFQDTLTSINLDLKI